ncbi:hypothetical protein PAL_GLEAN10005338 [Pteropus alecto]|uniref:Uncharacterized protein n=1 Tax=Pteropus alecto TaxID=9402 RepID=L5JTH7_PTEAL|nr:hypothetical protein PAL_GLEAN10005338 [Pteropus alecto]
MGGYSALGSSPFPSIGGPSLPQAAPQQPGPDPPCVSQPGSRPFRAGQRMSLLGPGQPSALQGRTPLSRLLPALPCPQGHSVATRPGPCEAPPRSNQQPTRHKGRQPRPSTPSVGVVKLTPTAVGPARPRGPSCHFHFCLLRPQREVGWGGEAAQQPSQLPPPLLGEALGARPRPPPAPGGLSGSGCSGGDGGQTAARTPRDWRPLLGPTLSEDGWTRTDRVVCPLPGGHGLVVSQPCWPECHAGATARCQLPVPGQMALTSRFEPQDCSALGSPPCPCPSPSLLGHLPPLGTLGTGFYK